MATHSSILAWKTAQSLEVIVHEAVKSWTQLSYGAQHSTHVILGSQGCHTETLLIFGAR